MLKIRRRQKNFFGAQQVLADRISQLQDITQVDVSEDFLYKVAYTIFMCHKMILRFTKNITVISAFKHNFFTLKTILFQFPSGGVDENFLITVRR